MRFIGILYLVLVFCSCGQRRQYPIEDIQLSTGFYKEALANINNQVRTSPSNLKLRYKRLFINAYLGWPQDGAEDIEQIVREEGLSREVYNYGADLYGQYQKYDKLLSLADQWESLSGEPAIQNKIIALDGLGKRMEAKDKLWEFLSENENNPEILTYVAGQYQNWGDTVRTAYTLNLLFGQEPAHGLLLRSYIPILLAAGNPLKAAEVLKFTGFDTASYSESALAGQVYFDIGEKSKAQGCIKNFDMSPAYKLRSVWYEKTNNMDSAVLMMDRVIQIDSSNAALNRKAALLWGRGLLYGARGVYQEALKRDSSNLIAREGIRVINRKIAYLQRLREREKQEPAPETSKKKDTEDE